MIFKNLKACVEVKSEEQYEELPEYDIQHDGNTIHCWIESTEDQVCILSSVKIYFNRYILDI